MNAKNVFWVVASLFLLAGCASAPPTTDVAVHAGMSRDDLRFYFGEPLRIEPAPSGGEDWYYPFLSWEPHPTGEAGTVVDGGEPTSYVSVGVGLSKDTVERPIHLSYEGYVIEPLPKGKVVKP